MWQFGYAASGFHKIENLANKSDSAISKRQVVSGSDGVFYPVLTDQTGTPRVVLDPTDGASRWEWEAKEAFGYQTPNAAPGTTAA
jgi:hypothetical protein